MRWEIQWRDLARAKEVGDVLHLDEWHRRLFVFEAGRNGQVHQPYTRKLITLDNT